MNIESQIELIKPEFIKQFGGRRVLFNVLEKYYNNLSTSGQSITNVSIIL